MFSIVNSKVPKWGLPMQNSDGDRERIAARINELVQANWQSSKRATLFSAIGYVVRKEFPNSDCLKDGLRAFLTSWPIVQVVYHPTIKEKVGAVPLGVPLPADPTSLFEPPARRNPAFVPEFWRAFYEPLKSRRFVLLEGPNRTVKVIETPDKPAETPSFEILPSDLANAQTGAVIRIGRGLSVINLELG